MLRSVNRFGIKQSHCIHSNAALTKTGINFRKVHSSLIEFNVLIQYNAATICMASELRKRWLLQYSRTNQDHTFHRLRAPFLKCLALSQAEITGESFIEKIRRWLTAVFHLWRLTAIVTPVIATAPVAFLMRSVAPTLAENWWGFAIHFARLSSPTLIKFIQWASSRRDMFPASFCDHFQTFHDNVSEHPWMFTEQTLCEAYGTEWERIVKIDKKPIGSGCIAQVYRGILVEDGASVAIKVIHPNVKRMVALDLDLMQKLISVLELLPLFRWVGARESVDEFSDIMQRQLNLHSEADNLKRFRQNFAHRSGLRFPYPYLQYSTENVLIETLEEGLHFQEFVKTCVDSRQRKKLARVILDGYLRMLFLDNFAHADLHPGNILFDVQTNRAGPFGSNHTEECVVAIDAGIVTRLSQDDLQNFVELFHAIATGNGYRAGELIVSRSKPITIHVKGEPTQVRCKDMDAFCRGIDHIISEALRWRLRLEKVQVGNLLKQVMELCCEHKVHLEGKYASIVISIAILESIGKVLDPDIDVLAAAFPIILQSRLKLIGKESQRD